VLFTKYHESVQITEKEMGGACGYVDYLELWEKYRSYHHWSSNLVIITWSDLSWLGTCFHEKQKKEFSKAWHELVVSGWKCCYRLHSVWSRLLAALQVLCELVSSLKMGQCIWRHWKKRSLCNGSASSKQRLWSLTYRPVGALATWRQ
jgi:hypothetical protein